MGKAHEDKCKRCGQCCRIKTVVLGQIFYSDKYCPFLKHEEDGKTTCTVYEDRLEKAPWCHKIEDSIKTGLAPDDCAYVPDGYKSKVRAEVDLG